MENTFEICEKILAFGGIGVVKAERTINLF